MLNAHVWLERKRAITVGFPSPAADFIEPPLYLNELVDTPEATYYARVGTEPDVVGIHVGDILVIDRALPHEHECIVLAVVGDRLILRRLRRVHGFYFLAADKNRLPTVEVRAEAIWGVVAYVVHKLTPRPRKRPTNGDDAVELGGNKK